MELRPLGNTGIQVSPIGLGTVKLGRAQGVKYPRPFEIPDDAAASALLERAAALGLNLIDTAPAYGASEERLGKLLGQRPDRARWVVVTKAGEEFADGVSSFDFSPAGIERSVERSLVRLKRDFVDVVLLHSDGRVELDAAAMEAALGALEKLKRAGKVRAFGASTKTVEGARWALSRCEVLMLTLNPGYLDERPVIEEAGRRGVGVLVKKVLASGHATGGASGGGAPGAIRLALTTAGVSSAIVGTINPEHLAENVRAAEPVTPG